MFVSELVTPWALVDFYTLQVGAAARGEKVIVCIVSVLVVLFARGLLRLH